MRKRVYAALFASKPYGARQEFTMDDGTVFIVQEPPPTRNRQTGESFPKDFSSAQRYGKIIHILGVTDQASLTPGPSLFAFKRALNKFDPERDFLCFAGGDPMSLALALLVLRDNNIKEVSVLRWERERATDGARKPGGFYVPITTPLRP